MQYFGKNRAKTGFMYYETSFLRHLFIDQSGLTVNSFTDKYDLKIFCGYIHGPALERRGSQGKKKAR